MDPAPRPHSFRSYLTPLLASTRLSQLAVASASIIGLAGITDALPAFSQPMISFDTPGTELPPGVRYSSISTGDFDGDGDIDLLLTGLERSTYTYITSVYENTGQNQGSGTISGTTLQSIGAGLTRVQGGYGSTAVGDFDGDGDLDLLISGQQEGYALSTTVYENTGQNQGSGSLDSNTFQSVAAGLTDVTLGSTGVGDFDGDGDLDLLITGEDAGGNPTTIVYENTGQNQGDGTLGATTFQAVGAGLTGVAFSSLEIDDFDGDADLDLLVTGENAGGNPTAIVYENTGQNQGGGTLGATTFQAIGSGLTGTFLGDTAAGDLDGDGDIDLLITGYDDSFDGQTILYENTGPNQGAGSLGASTFQAVTTNLPSIGYTAIAIGDYEADGDLDLLIAGGDDSIQADIYENTGQNQGGGTLGSGTFQAANIPFTGIELGAAVTADLDGDLDLDLVITGSDDNGNDTGTIYDNTSDNPIPVELVSFSAKKDGGSILLRWITASETGNAGFEVQHLIGPPGSGMFQPLGFVEGAGTTSEVQSYQFNTGTFPVGNHRFRLMQVDLDGTKDYSDVVEVQLSISESYRLSPPTPNPAVDGARIRLTVDQAQMVDISVFDLLGRRVQTPFNGPISAQTERMVNVGDSLPSGVYFIRVRGERFATTERLTIIR